MNFGRDRELFEDESQTPACPCFSESLLYALNTLQFNFADVAQYWLSLDNFLEHIGSSDHRISQLRTSTDQVCFAFMVLGTGCTLISNQYAYFLLNKEQATGQKQKVNLGVWQRRGLGVIVLISVLNKSIATASSFYALLLDYGRPQIMLYIHFGLALAAHCLAQSAVQGVSGNWHAGFSKKLSQLLSAFSALYYTISLLALNWNTLDNVSKTFGWLDSRPHITSSAGVIKLSVVSPFFIGSLLRTPVVYYNRKMDRLLSEEKALQRKEEAQEQAEEPEGRNSCCNVFQKVTAGLTIVQRSGVMLLSLGAIVYGGFSDEAIAVFMAVISSVFACWGTLKSNAAVLYPTQEVKLSNNRRFLLNYSFVSDDPEWNALPASSGRSLNRD